MKLLMLIGAIGGFCLGAAVGLARQTGWSTMLWHACAAAAVLGLLMRWWGRIWIRNLHRSVEERRATRPVGRPQTPAIAPVKK